MSRRRETDIRNAFTCTACGRLRDGLRFRGFGALELVLRCEDCYTAATIEETAAWYAMYRPDDPVPPPEEIAALRFSPKTCAACGAPFVWTRFRRSRKGGCSQGCDRELRNQPRRIIPVSRSCVVCGETFVPTRADAKTCSSPCRQKAYRDRKMLAQHGAVE